MVEVSKNTSIFRGVIQFSSGSTEYRATQVPFVSYVYKVETKVGDGSFIHQKTVSIRGKKATPKNILTAFIDNEEIL